MSTAAQTGTPEAGEQLVDSTAARGVIYSVCVLAQHPYLAQPFSQTSRHPRREKARNLVFPHPSYPRPQTTLNGWAHEGVRVGAAGSPGDAPWWLSFLRAAVLLSNAGGVDCGLEYLFWCLFFGITLASGC